MKIPFSHYWLEVEWLRDTAEWELFGTYRNEVGRWWTIGPVSIAVYDDRLDFGNYN